MDPACLLEIENGARTSVRIATPAGTARRPTGRRRAALPADQAAIVSKGVGSMHSGAHQPIAGICVRGRWPRRATLAVLLAVSGAATAGAPEQAQAGSVATDASPAGDDLADLSLEQLLDVRVSTASRFEQSASDAPSAVRV